MNCRSCGENCFAPVINLGNVPLANRLLAHPHDPAPRFPLSMVLCTSCGLGQIEHTVPPAEMFSNYCYFSSNSQTMVSHARALVGQYVKPGQNVLEIASNDGYLLSWAKRAGAQVLGIEPALNIARHAQANGIPTRSEYFDTDLADSIIRDWGQADVLFANNVLAHVPDPNAFAVGMKRCLAPQGVAHIEVPSLVTLIQSSAFDTIYHEHYSYFSLSALKSLFNRCGLRIVDVHQIGIHGGSFHLTIMHDGDESRALQWQQQELSEGLLDGRLISGFQKRVDCMCADVRHTLAGFDSIAGYGAAAKAAVFLNYCNIHADVLPWVADVSAHKQGRFIPGTQQPIVSPARLIDDRPQAVLVLVWNLIDEITRLNADYLHRGGTMITAVPDVRIFNRQPSRSDSCTFSPRTFQVAS